MEEAILHTTLVQGSLAQAMRRATAARNRELGLQIYTAPQLAARLAGSLLLPASRASVENGIRAALKRCVEFADLGPVSAFPGLTRALRRTLGNIWRSGYDLRGAVADIPRLRDLAFIEEEIRNNLLPGELLLPDLLRQARANLEVAPTIIGSLSIDGIHSIDPIWRPLIDELAQRIDVSQKTSEIKNTALRSLTAISCADPAHEALEAMRWARALLADGRARPEEIAICATSTSPWDDYLLAHGTNTELPFCFLHGRPALATRDGQRCAALADVLRGGLSQARVRRLISLLRNQGTELDDLPDENLPVSGSASLSTAADWRRALSHRPDFSNILLPILDELQGMGAAEKAAERLLRGRSLRLWEEALRAAPASALMFTLGTLRVADERDPADAIIWCSASELAGAPRKFVWLLGVTAGSWPRANGLDPILPPYLVDRTLTDPDPVEQADVRCHQIITTAACEAVLSTGRLTIGGKSANPSTLLPFKPEQMKREEATARALSEADRLFSSSADLATDPITATAGVAWCAWHRSELTPADGLVGKPHSLLSALLTEPQSPTSLSRLLQDPLAYVWYYALGWRDLQHKERGLILPADDMGRLVHEILRRAVDHLEPEPGLAGAADYQKEEAVEKAAELIEATWPAHTDVPPPVLWGHTVRQAGELALAGLNHKPMSAAGTRSHTEVAFGGAQREEPPVIAPPWDPSTPVVLPGTDIRIYGSIDRLDLRANLERIRVTDYKTGQRPEDPTNMIVRYGGELQRVLYALACRALLGDQQAPLVARLVYLRPPVADYTLKDPDATIAMTAQWVAVARHTLEAGILYPGLSDYERSRRPFRLALPASRLSYLKRKTNAVRKAVGSDLTGYWKSK